MPDLSAAMSMPELESYLEEVGIAGPHQSHSRENNLTNIRKCVAGEDGYTFGLSTTTSHSVQDVLGWLGELTGCSTDLDDPCEADTMDPRRTIAAVIAAGRRLREAAGRGARLLIATGHPTGVLDLYIRIADAYTEAGGKLLTILEDELLPERKRGKHEEVRYIGGVGVLADWGNLKHTHSEYAMQCVLDAGPVPDLVLGDHGWAGAAADRHVPTIAIMDINDPALAVAWGEGRDITIVPLDDNRPPRLYEPLARLFTDVIRGNDPAGL